MSLVANSIVLQPIIARKPSIYDVIQDHFRLVYTHLVNSVITFFTLFSEEAIKMLVYIKFQVESSGVMYI